MVSVKSIQTNWKELLLLTQCFQSYILSFATFTVHHCNNLTNYQSESSSALEGEHLGSQNKYSHKTDITTRSALFVIQIPLLTKLSFSCPCHICKLLLHLQNFAALTLQAQDRCAQCRYIDCARSARPVCLHHPARLQSSEEKAVMEEAVSPDYCQSPQTDAIPSNIATGNLPPLVVSCTMKTATHNFRVKSLNDWAFHLEREGF